MKKILTFILTACMILSSLTPAFAAEKNTTSEMNSVKEEAVARNVDLATIPTQTWTGSITFQVTPSKGDNMKLHLYIYDGGCDVFVIKGAHPTALIGGKRVAAWGNTGHQYVDLVRNCENTTYTVTLYTGTLCTADGGIYTEP